MRTLFLLSLTLVVACGGRQQPTATSDGEHGLTGEWERAEAEKRQLEAAKQPPHKETPTEIVAEPEQYHGCGFPSTAEVPYPCGRPDGAVDPTLPVPAPPTPTVAPRGVKLDGSAKAPMRPSLNGSES